MCVCMYVGKPRKTSVFWKKGEQIRNEDSVVFELEASPDVFTLFLFAGGKMRPREPLFTSSSPSSSDCDMLWRVLCLQGLLMINQKLGWLHGWMAEINTV
jgi:hypothetical protein